MLSTRKLSRQEILDSSSKLPFSSRDRQMLLLYLRHSGRNGLDLSIKAEQPADSLETMIQSGVLHFQSASLHAQFMVVNFHCGTSPLGLTQSRIFLFYSDSGDGWIPLISNPRLRPIFKVITNMYGYAGKDEPLPGDRHPNPLLAEAGVPADLSRRGAAEKLAG